ncbi:kelch-like protein 10 [Clinocottus analis]|uniref:kelch-like protein 10 n=1 Tax=Clinocottus analis TaxID=304258 RepID=UPI0035C14632
MSVYNELRLEQKLCDAVIRVDNVTFPVHKIILCNCSTYFKALFTIWSTPDSQDFHIPDVSPDIMKLIIEFAYTDSVHVTQENIQELFVSADKFDVQGIVQACCSFLEALLSPRNCISIWWFTDFYYTPKLNQKAFLYMMNYFEAVASTSEEFLLLSIQELVKIIENDQLNVRQEKTVFGAIVRWVCHATEERKEYIPLLLSTVRLALMSPKFLTDVVRNSELVLANKECRPILIKKLAAMLDFQTKMVPGSSFYNTLDRPRLSPTIMLAVGGWSAGRPINSIEAYDVRADRWINVPNNDETPRAYHGAVFLHGSVYCVGGFDNVQQFRSVHRFDLATHIWYEVTSMHLRRCYVSVTVMDGCIYALGGYDGRVRLRSAERYQPSSNQWTVIAPMHEQRSDAHCTTLHGKLYICGGFNGSECLSTAECYNPETNQWTLIASMDSGRSGLRVIAYANHVFAVGGFNGTRRLDTVEAYNPNTNTWLPMPSMLNCRSNFGIAVIDDCLFVLGGYNGSRTTLEVECYDFTARIWSYVSGMEISRSALSCCTVYGLPNLADYSAPRQALQPSNREEDALE